MLGRSDDAIAVYDELIARDADRDELALREPVAKALVNKGVTLGVLGRSDDAIAVYDELIARDADRDELALREQVANALVNKGVTLGVLGRSDDASRRRSRRSRCWQRSCLDRTQAGDGQAGPNASSAAL